jgi:cobyrinic acid a,c-diamide synthase
MAVNGEKSARPRIVISGLSGGSGKTVVTLGLIELYRRNGLAVAPFKKGPDYIDVSWHALSAGRPSYNLDTFLMQSADILSNFESQTRLADIAIVEGNRGLYDGMDNRGTHSTAELAKLLDAPALLVVNCTKSTRTIAAIVLGCKMMDPHLNLAGVILNQVANIRQESIIRAAVEQEAGVPVVGAVPRVRDLPFSERHLGLLPPEEHPRAKLALERLHEAMVQNLDADRIFAIASSAPPLTPAADTGISTVPKTGDRPRIGVFRDSAFTFYYPDNLDALERHGARLVEISGLRDVELPHVDALYIGGGFPETHAHELAKNESLRASIRREVEDGLPVYAECGGLIYLGEAVEFGGKRFPMAGVFPVTFSIKEKPQGHGYVVVEVDRPNPFFPVGTILKGHEFHYAAVQEYNSAAVETAFLVKRGYGFDCGRDGLCYKNSFASFCHIHALGEKEWAKTMVRLAEQRMMKPSGIEKTAEANRDFEVISGR